MADVALKYYTITPLYLALLLPLLPLFTAGRSGKTSAKVLFNLSLILSATFDSSSTFTNLEKLSPL